MEQQLYAVVYHHQYSPQGYFVYQDGRLVTQ
jgi:hypothetical protein